MDGLIPDVREKNYRAVEKIDLAFDEDEFRISDFVGDDMLSELPIRISGLILHPDETPDFELSFLTPMPVPEFELLFQKFCSNPGRIQDFQDEQYYLYHWIPYELASDVRAGAHGCAESYVWNLEWLLGQIHPTDKKVWPPRTFLHHTDWTSSEMRFDPTIYGTRQRGYIDECIYQNEKAIVWYVESLYAQHYIGKYPSGTDCSGILPHVACTIVHAAPFDQGPLRSEIRCVTMIMKNRMRWHAWKAHRFFPVFCYTFNGPFARITQGYWDGQYLQIRQSTPIEVAPADGSLEGLRILLRWILGKPNGSTKWDPAERESSLGARMKEGHDPDHDPKRMTVLA